MIPRSVPRLKLPKVRSKRPKGDRLLKGFILMLSAVLYSCSSDYVAPTNIIASVDWPTFREDGSFIYNPSHAVVYCRYSNNPPEEYIFVIDWPETSKIGPFIGHLIACKAQACDEDNLCSAWTDEDVYAIY